MGGTTVGEFGRRGKNPDVDPEKGFFHRQLIPPGKPNGEGGVKRKKIHSPVKPYMKGGGLEWRRGKEVYFMSAMVAFLLALSEKSTSSSAKKRGKGEWYLAKDAH